MFGRVLVPAALAAALAAQPEGVPSGFSNLLVVRDLLPHLDTALRSKQIAELLRRSPMLRAGLESEGFPVGALRTASHLLGPFIPRQVVIAAPKQTVAALGQLVSLGCHLLILQLGELEEAERTALVAAVPGHFEHLQQLPLYVEVRARTPALAEQWFDRLDELLEDVPAGRGLTSTFGDGRIEMSFAPSEMKQWQGWAEQFAWARKAAALRWSATLVRDGDRLVLTAGAQDGKLAADAMHPLWREGGEPLLFAQCDLTQLLAAEDGVSELLETHRDALQPALDARPELRLGIDQMVASLSSLDATTALSLHLLDDGLDWRQHSKWGVDLDIDEPLPAHGLLAMVDPEKSAFSLVNAPLDLLLIGSVESIRDQLRRQALRRERRDGTGAERMDAIDARLDTLSDYLLEDFGAAFAGGAGLLAEGSTALRGVEVLAADDTVAARWQPQGLELPAVALLAHIDDEDDAWAFVAGFSNALARALFGGAAEAPLAAVDLGLGVPTRGSGATLALGEGGQLRLYGDLVPHWFVRDDTLVFSTSVALSRTLIARASAAAADAAAATFGWHHVSGTNLGGHLRAALQALAALGSDPAREFRRTMGLGDTSAAAQLAAVAQEVAVWCAAIAEIDIRDRLVDGEFHSHMRLRWAQELKFPDAPADAGPEPERAKTARLAPARPDLLPVHILAEAPADRSAYLALPDGTYVATLNGATGAPAMDWPTDRPFSPIVGKERAADGTEWFVHADGSRSTTTMVFRADLGRKDAVTQVALRTAR